jgi:hypothetical protein
MNKTITIGDFVTEEMFAQIVEIGMDVGRIAKEVIEPNLGVINLKFRQKNDPHYLAYCVVHALQQSQTCMAKRAMSSVEEVRALIETSTPENWSRCPEQPLGGTAVEASLGPWQVMVVYSEEHQDGTAVKAAEGLVLHLTPELAREARRRATGLGL